jgi:hypothetical protein
MEFINYDGSAILFLGEFKNQKEATKYCLKNDIPYMYIWSTDEFNILKEAINTVLTSGYDW